MQKDAQVGILAMITHTMNSILKKITLSGAALVVVGGGAIGGLRLWLGKSLSKEALVSQMETAWNCRAGIDDVRLVLFSNPARLEIIGCRLWPRDGEVGKALATRTAIEPGPISIGNAVLEVKLQDLVARRLNVQQLTLTDISVVEEITKDGQSSLGQLFQRPTKESAPVTVIPPEKTEAPVPPAPTTTDVESPGPSADKTTLTTQAPAVHAPELGYSIRVDRASLERANLMINNRKNTTLTTLSDLSFTISEIDIDPADLLNHNSLQLLLDTRIVVRDHVTIKGVHQPVNHVDLRLQGEGKVRPLDSSTGLWSASSDLHLALLKGSLLAGYMKIGDIESKDLKKLDEYGIDLRDVSMGGPLSADANIRIRFSDDRILFMDDANFAMPDYELSVGKESWLNPPEDQHELNLRIYFGSKVQEQLVQGLVKFGLGQDQAGAMLKGMSDEKGRFYLDLKSTGKLAKPKVKPDTSRLLNRVIQGMGSGLLEGLLKGAK
jgi:hypothetical protein